MLVLGSSVLVASSVAPGPARPVTPERAGALLARAPLSFEATADGRFAARSVDYSVVLDGGDAAVSLPSGAGKPRAGLNVSLPGRTPQPVAYPRRPLAATSNYLLGDDPARWRTGVRSFAEVAYDGVWPGVDTVWHGRNDQLEVDFVVAPRADPSVVGMDFEGADTVTVDASGELVVDVGGREARLRAPSLYQDGRRGREPVDGGFVLRGPQRVGFRVGPHDPDRPLVIDPVLVSSSYLGGDHSDAAFGVAVDSTGNVYITGSTESGDFPTEGPVQPNLMDANTVRTDAFVTKLNPAGTQLVYSTYLGGKGHDIGYGIAVGADGSPYIIGSTDSTDFPLSKPFRRNYGGGASDAFVVKLGPQGAAIDYSTFLGGSGTDLARGIALDQSGAVVVVGSTSSPDFPTSKPLQGGLRTPDDTDAFVVKVNPTGSDLLYSTFLGGTGPDHAVAVAVDSTGAAYVTGDTRSNDFPTANALQPSANASASSTGPSIDVFVTKLDTNGAALVYSTYLGGSDTDQASSIAVDAEGSVSVTGNTNSTNYPVVRPVQDKKNGDTDAFVSRLSSSGSILVFSTYLGGSAADGATGITVDRLGRTSITGGTASSDFPLFKPFQPTKAGGFTEAFVATLGADGSSLAFSSYLGGRDEDLGSAITSDRDGNLYVAGYTNSTDFPTVHPLQPAKGGGVGDAFIAKVGDQAKPAASTSSSPAREHRIQFLLAVTILLFIAAIGQTMWLRRRRIPIGPPPVPESAFGGMVVGRLGGDQYAGPPPSVRRVEPILLTEDDYDDEGDAPLPLVTPVRPLRSSRDEASPEPTGEPAEPLTEGAPKTPVEAGVGATADPWLSVDPLFTLPEPDLVPEDPALSETWAEAPISDDVWGRPEPAEPVDEMTIDDVRPRADDQPDADATDLAVPDLLPDPAPVQYDDEEVEMWQMMTVDPEPGLVAEETASLWSGQSMSDLLDEEMPIPETDVPLEEGLSIADLLDENLSVPDEQPSTEVDDDHPADGDQDHPATEVGDDLPEPEPQPDP